MFWFLPALAASPAPALTAWATESKGRSQLVLTLGLGRRACFDPSHVYRIDLLHGDRPVGRVSCRLVGRKRSPMHCRIEGPGGPVLLELPQGEAREGAGVRGFVGQLPAERERALVFLFDTESIFGAKGLLSIHGMVETVRWEPSPLVGRATYDGSTQILIEPEPWTSIESITVTLNDQTHSLSAGRSLVVPTSWLTKPIGVDLDDAHCLVGARSGARTAILRPISPRTCSFATRVQQYTS